MADQAGTTTKARSKEERIKDLLVGAVDSHCHSGPSVMPRDFNHVEAMMEAVEVGMKAMLIKDHYYSATPITELLKQKAAQCLVLALRELELKLLVNGLDLHPGLDDPALLGDLFVGSGLDVVLVADLADDLLDDVLESQDADGAAMLVDEHVANGDCFQCCGTGRLMTREQRAKLVAANSQKRLDVHDRRVAKDCGLSLEEFRHVSDPKRYPRQVGA